MDYLTNFYKNKADSLKEKITILENQLKLMEMNVTAQSPEQIAAMNNPAKGGQSGKFGGNKRKPATESDWAAQQRHAGISDLVQDTLATAGKKDDFDTSLSLGIRPGVAPSKPSAPKQDAMGMLDDTLKKAGGLLSSMTARAAAPKTTTPSAPSAPAPSSQPSAQATKTTSQPTQKDPTDAMGPRRVQATSDPLLSTYEPGGFAVAPSSKDGLGKIQLVPSEGGSEEQQAAQVGDWGKRRLEAEVGYQPSRTTRVGTMDTYQQIHTDPVQRAREMVGGRGEQQNPNDALRRFRDEEREMLARVNAQRGTNFNNQFQGASPRATAGVDVEGPPSPTQPKPQEKESLGSQLIRGFRDMGSQLFGLPSSVAKAGENIQRDMQNMNKNRR
jgi:hypothetical protein